MEIDQIYTELIKEHSLYSDNKKSLDDATDSQLGANPSCGDEITLNIRVKDDIIEDASFEGVGCAISQASASMMIDIVKGKTISEAKHDVKNFLKMIKNEDLTEEELENLEDAVALQNISKLPARVKCAVLAWRTLDKLLTDK